MAMSNQYTLYHLHSDLSNGVTNIDSVTKYGEYIERAKECGMKAMAFTEHGSVFEWWHKKSAIEAAGMKYIHGIEAYLNNPLTESIVFGGLEPLEQFNELCSFLEVLRGQFQCKDDVVIYTGYYFEEVPEWIQQLATYGNVIVKFGRYIPNQKHIFDEVLGVELASDNQYAERFDS